jgi:hypothetical protein
VFQKILIDIYFFFLTEILNYLHGVTSIALPFPSLDAEIRPAAGFTPGDTTTTL